MALFDVSTDMMRFYNDVASKRGRGGWRAVGAVMGISGSYARQLARGDKRMTPDLAALWLIANGWEPRRTEVKVCPTCASRGVYTSHGDGLDCQGRPVAAAVCLAPNEVVAKAPKQKTEPHPDVKRMTSALAKLLTSAPLPEPRCYNQRGRLTW